MASEQSIERIRAILNSDSLSFGIRIKAGGSTVTASSGDDEVEMSTNAARKVLESIRPAWGDDCAEVIMLGGLIEAAEAENTPSPRPQHGGGAE